MKKLVLILTVPFTLSACVSLGPVKYDQYMSEKVSKTASFDFQCPKDKLNISQIDTSTYGVYGCGKRGTYIGRDITCNPNNTQSNLDRFCVIVPDTFSGE